MPNTFSYKNIYDTIKLIVWVDEEVYTFLKDISSKMNVIVRLAFELAYNNVVVQHVNHYTKETLPI